MKYSISDIANLLGISIVTVRNYEKCGLIEPQRNEQNNYRQYNAIDLNLIRRARAYMGYGFSLDKAKRMLCEEDLSGLAKELKSREKEMEEQLRWDYYRLQFVKKHASYLERLSVGLGECATEISPAFFGLVYRERTKMFDDQRLSEKVRLWNNMHPFAETLMIYRKESFTGNEKQYMSGLCMEEQYAHYFSIEEDQYVQYYPPKKSVHTIIPVTFEPDQDYSEFQFKYVMDWVEQRGLTITGDAIGRVLHTSKASGKWMHYSEVWVPIE